MSNNDVPIWEKYTLTIEEASKYFRIGENKLRRLAEENPTAGWVILNGNRIHYAIILLKRVKALSVMERSMTKCQKKNEMKKGGTAKAAF